MAIKEGDVFSLETKVGLGFVQYITTFENGVEFIRVLEPIKETKVLSQFEVDIKERFNVQFPIKVALRKKLIQKIEHFNIPSSFKIPSKGRSEHTVRGEFLGWHIVDIKTLHRELKKELSDKELALSPYGIFNDTLIVEYLEKNWRLENWK